MQKLGSTFVLLLLFVFIVLPTIKFNDAFFLYADEINTIEAQGARPAKF